MTRSLVRVVVAQVALAVLLGVLVVAVTAVGSGLAALATVGLARIEAVAFGSLLGILATVVTARSVVKSAKAATKHPHFGMLPVYSGLLLKLLIVAGGAFVGLEFWTLGPLYMVLGYLVMQAGYLWAGTGFGR